MMSFWMTPSQMRRNRSELSLQMPRMKRVDQSTPIPLLKSNPARSWKSSSRSVYPRWRIWLAVMTTILAGASLRFWLALLALTTSASE